MELQVLNINSAGGSFIVAPTDLGLTHLFTIKNFTNQGFLFQNAKQTYGYQ